MALVLADRVQDTTTTAGTGTITLSGSAPAGFQSFAVVGDGNTTYYTITSGNDWEVGIGTYTSSGTTLSRDTVLSSSAAGAKITLAGTSTVFVTLPSERAVTSGATTDLVLPAPGTSSNVLTSNGTAWVSSAPAAPSGPTLTAVASGSLSDGSTVAVNADGTVSVVGGLAQVVGSASLFNTTTGSSEISSAYDVNAQKIAGTVATTSGSATVTGTSTLFTTQVAAGDKLVIGANTYTVSVVGSNTSITLTGNASANASGVVAKVVKAASDFFAAPVTSITSSNVEAIIDAVYKAIPVEVLDKEDLFIACGTDVFRLYTIALKNANLYHYGVDAVNFELFIPGTNIKLVALNGLNGTSRVIAMRKSNGFMGVDLMNEEERFEIFYARENDEIRFMSAFKVGTQVAFPSQIANFELTA